MKVTAVLVCNTVCNAVQGGSNLLVCERKLLKAFEQYFPVVLLIMVYKVVQTFQFEDKILKCNLSN